MHQYERHTLILKSARALPRVEVTTLADELDVTPETVRRDLTQLEKQGLIRRVHGGAVLAEKMAFEPSIAERTATRAEEKQRIASAALEHLPAAGSVLFDAGTTTIEVVKAMPRQSELNVLTNSLPIADVVARRPDLHLHLLGGRVRSHTDATIGTWAMRALEEVHVDVAFMGTNGLATRTGLTTPDQSEAAVKAAMIASAGRVVVLADSSKLGQAHFARFGQLSEVDIIITDDSADPDMTEEIRALGPEVVIA